MRFLVIIFLLCGLSFAYASNPAAGTHQAAGVKSEPQAITSVKNMFAHIERADNAEEQIRMIKYVENLVSQMSWDTSTSWSGVMAEIDTQTQRLIANNGFKSATAAIALANAERENGPTDPCSVAAVKMVFAAVKAAKDSEEQVEKIRDLKNLKHPRLADVWPEIVSQTKGLLKNFDFKSTAVVQALAEAVGESGQFGTRFIDTYEAEEIISKSLRRLKQEGKIKDYYDKERFLQIIATAAGKNISAEGEQKPDYSLETYEDRYEGRYAYADILKADALPSVLRSSIPYLKGEDLVKQISAFQRSPLNSLVLAEAVLDRQLDPQKKLDDSDLLKALEAAVSKTFGYYWYSDVGGGSNWLSGVLAQWMSKLWTGLTTENQSLNSFLALHVGYSAGDLKALVQKAKEGYPPRSAPSSAYLKTRIMTPVVAYDFAQLFVRYKSVLGDDYSVLFQRDDQPGGEPVVSELITGAPRTAFFYTSKRLLKKALRSAEGEPSASRTESWRDALITVLGPKKCADIIQASDHADDEVE